MERVGLIGLGNMGMGMAKNLVKKGFKLTAYDIREEPLKEIASLGADIAESSRGVGEQSEVVFTMVLNGAQVREVVLGEQGLIEGLRPGSTLICTATIMRSIIIEVARTLEELLRQRLAHRVALRRLPEAEVSAMLRALSGQEPPKPLVDESTARRRATPSS